MRFLSFLLCLFLLSYLFRSLAQGLVSLSDRVVRRVWRAEGIDDLELSLRFTRGVACWNYGQAVTLGSLYALLLSGLREGFAAQGAEHWIYTLTLLVWCLGAGIGFRTNPGSVFLSCFAGVVFFSWFGLPGILAVWILMLGLLIPIYRSAGRAAGPVVSKSGETVIVDVEALP